jgi:small subunit ribosomal protein S1
LSVGQSVDGKIREKAHFGWLIEIRPGVVGLLPKSALKEATDEKTIEQKKVGESLHLRIQGIRPEEKRISLSLPSDQDDTSWQEFSPATGAAAAGMGTLGDQFSKLFKK